MRPYTPADYPTLCSWLEARGLPPVPEDFLPADGLVEDGLAMGFVDLSEQSPPGSGHRPLALVDCFATNPAALPSPRAAALERVCLGLFDLARSRGCKLVVGQTKISPTQLLGGRLARVGVRDLGHHAVFALDLR